jgi:hypothetical protein
LDQQRVLRQFCAVAGLLGKHPVGDASWFALLLLDLDCEEPLVRVTVLVVEEILFQLPGHGHLTRQPQRLATFSEAHV